MKKVSTVLNLLVILSLLLSSLPVHAGEVARTAPSTDTLAEVRTALQGADPRRYLPEMAQSALGEQAGRDETARLLDPLRSILGDSLLGMLESDPLSMLPEGNGATGGQQLDPAAKIDPAAKNLTLLENVQKLLGDFGQPGWTAAEGRDQQPGDSDQGSAGNGASATVTPTQKATATPYATSEQPEPEPTADDASSSSDSPGGPLNYPVYLPWVAAGSQPVGNTSPATTVPTVTVTNPIAPVAPVPQRSTSVPAAAIDPCAEGIILLADTTKPLVNAPLDGMGNIIPQNTYYTAPAIPFRHFGGTEVYLSGDDTGDIMDTDPNTMGPLLTHDRAYITLPQGTWQKAFSTNTALPAIPLGLVTTLFPPFPVPAPNVVVPRYIDSVAGPAVLIHDSSPTYGSNGYYVVRDDIVNPWIVDATSWHDGEGGVRVRAFARDNCAVGQVLLTYSSSSGGGGTVAMQWVQADAVGGYTTDGRGVYEASIQLPKSGVNTYTIVAYDMDKPTPLASAPETWSEQAGFSRTSGSGLLSGSESCSEDCGGPCTAGCSGDPVNTATGNFTYNTEDITIPGAGEADLVIERSYNSSGVSDALNGPRDRLIGPFGLGWSSDLNFTLEIMNDTHLIGVKVNYPAGNTARYSGSSGTLTPLTPGVVDKLATGGPGYILSMKNLTQFHFNGLGQLVKKLDPNGNAIVFSPGIYGPTSISSGGRTLSLSYGATHSVTNRDGSTTVSGFVTLISGPGGLNLQYGYSGALLTSFSDSRGKTTQYSYSGNWLATITTAKGHPALRMEYDTWGRVTKQTIGAGEGYSYSYDDAAFKRTITDANGNAEIHTYDSNFRLLKVQDALGFTEEYTYNGQDLRATFKDKNGFTWSYTYDGRANLTRSNGPFGWSQTYTYNGQDLPTSYSDALGRTTNFTYDGAGNLTSLTNADGKTLSISYDRGMPQTITDFRGNVTTNSYDGAGDLISTKNAENNTFTLGYDALGRLTSLATPEGTTYSYTYDLASQLIKSVAAPLGFQLSYAYDDNGNLKTETDARGNITTYSYNTSDRLASITDQLSGVQSFTYNVMNKVVAQSDAEGRTTSYTYDAVYNQIQVDAPEGRSTKYTYDGKRNLLSLTDPLGRKTEYRYDGLDRRSQQRADATGINASTDYTYDLAGNLLSEKDPDGFITTHSYDSLNRRKTSTNAENETLTYQYDENGNLLKLIDGNSNPTTLTYDRADRLLTITNAENEVVRFVYNGLGNPTQITNPRGVVTQLTYDELYRVKKVVTNPGGAMAAGGASAADVTYQMVYDLNDNLIQVSDPLGKNTQYEYDALNRLSKETDALTQTTHYAYDKVGNLTRLTNKRNHASAFQYDGANRLIEVKDARNGLTTLAYNKADNLTSITDANNHATALSYDGLNRLIGVMTPAGNATQTTYSAAGDLLTITDARSHVTTLAYDRAHRLVTATDAENGITRLAYDEAGNVIQVTDANNHLTSLTLDKAYRPIAISDPLLFTTLLTYDDNGNVTQVTDGNNQNTTYSYDALDRTLTTTNAENETNQIAYDKADNVRSVTSPRGIVSSFEYDDLHRLITRIEGTINGAAGNGDTNVTTRIEYDANDNVSKVTDGEGHATQYSYDELDRPSAQINALNDTIGYVYDAVGNLTQLTNRRGFHTRFTYDVDDRLSTITDALNGVTTLRYDGNDNLLSVVDANNHTSSYSYDKLNRLTSSVNPETHAVTLAYDKVGNLSQVTDARGNSTNLVYDAKDRLSTITDALSGVTELRYDALENVTSIIDANNHTTSAQYDRAYRLTTITDAENHSTQLAYDDDGNITSVIDGNTHTTSFVYDKLNRLVEQTNAANEKTRYSYDRVGNLLDTIENDNVTTRNGYDALYRLTSVTLNLVAGAPVDHQTNVRYDYGYDKNDNLAQISDPLSHSTTFAYDELDRLSRETNPLSNVWNYEYDPVGNLSKRIDAENQATIYSYYPDDQLKKISYDDGSAVDFSYDANNNLTGMVDSLGSSNLVYDALNRVSSTTDSLGRTLRYGYDAVGNRTSLTYPNGSVIGYRYYNNDWLRSMTDSAGRATTYQRDGVGQMTETRYANGVVARAQYDAANRLTKLENRRADGDLITSYKYTLDSVGQRKSAQMEYGRPWPQLDVTENYAYDPLRRLTGVSDSAGFQASYEYDAVGNRTRWRANDDQTTPRAGDGFVTTYEYNAANQLLAERKDFSNFALSADDSLTAYNYDRNGNRTGKYSQGLTTAWPYENGTDYRYDRENRLTQATDYRINRSLLAGNRVDLQATNLRYDGMGRRLDKQYREYSQVGLGAGAANGRLDQTEYVFDGLDIVADYPVVQQGEVQGRNDHYNEYYRGDMGDIVAQRRFPQDAHVVPDVQSYWYHYNGRRDVVSLSTQDDRGWLHYRYDAYGQSLPEWGNVPHEYYRSQNRFGLTGKEWDAGLGMYYFGVREYEPQQATWITQDRFQGIPIAPTTLHRYGFVMGNPINLVDQYGFWGFPSWNDVSNGIGNFVNKATETVGNVANTVANTASNVAGQIVDTAVEVGRATGKFISEHRDEIALGAAVVAAGVLTVATGGLAAPIIAGAFAAGGTTALINVGSGKDPLDGVIKNTINGAIVGATVASGGFLSGGAIAGKTISQGIVNGASKAVIEIASEVIKGQPINIQTISSTFGGGFIEGLTCFGVIYCSIAKDSVDTISNNLQTGKSWSEGVVENASYKYVLDKISNWGLDKVPGLKINPSWAKPTKFITALVKGKTSMRDSIRTFLSGSTEETLKKFGIEDWTKKQLSNLGSTVMQYGNCFIDSFKEKLRYFDPPYLTFR